MFLCPKCRHEMSLPQCDCGYTVKQQDGIWQLTDMPDIIKDGDGDKYIGYEDIGDTYSGERRYQIEGGDKLFAFEISQLTEDGIFLDLACGDGCLTVPCAKNGTHVIASDISNRMLTILQEKAVHNSVSLENVTLCRMNALDIPIADNSIDTVAANSVLHLISNPEKVVREIHRVLKPGGTFICLDDAPGKVESEKYDNSRYLEIQNYIYREYWNRLAKIDIAPTKYSWKFDRNAICDMLFDRKTEKIIPRGDKYEIPLKNGFLPRFCGRGFSDQTDVPNEIHNKVIAELMNDCRSGFGNNFADTPFCGVYEDMLVTIYTK